MPEGRYGHPTLAELAAMDGQKQLNDGYKKWDALLCERVATAGALPAPSARPSGHVIFVDAEGGFRVTTGSSWIVPGARPMCVLGKTSNQSVSGTLAAVTWDSEIVDAFGMHANSPNPSRIIAPVAGVYEVLVSGYVAVASGVGVLQGRKNGTTDIAGSFFRRDATSPAQAPLRTFFSVVLAANDYIEIMASHTGGGSIAGGTAAGSASVTVKRIGDS